MSGGGRSTEEGTRCDGPSALVQLLEQLSSDGAFPCPHPPPHTHTHPDVLTLVAHTQSEYVLGQEERGGPGTNGNVEKLA